MFGDVLLWALGMRCKLVLPQSTKQVQKKKKTESVFATIYIRKGKRSWKDSRETSVKVRAGADERAEVCVSLQNRQGLNLKIKSFSPKGISQGRQVSASAVSQTRPPADARPSGAASDQGRHLADTGAPVPHSRLHERMSRIMIPQTLHAAAV